MIGVYLSMHFMLPKPNTAYALKKPLRPFLLRRGRLTRPHSIAFVRSRLFNGALRSNERKRNILKSRCNDNLKVVAPADFSARDTEYKNEVYGASWLRAEKDYG